MRICNFSKKLFLCSVIIFVLFSFSISESFAQNTQSIDNSQIDINEFSDLEKYNIGIMLENVGEINRQSGSYDLIFWVIITFLGIKFINLL